MPLGEPLMMRTRGNGTRPPRTTSTINMRTRPPIHPASWHSHKVSVRDDRFQFTSRGRVRHRRTGCSLVRDRNANMRSLWDFLAHGVLGSLAWYQQRAYLALGPAAQCDRSCDYRRCHLVKSRKYDAETRSSQGRIKVRAGMSASYFRKFLSVTRLIARQRRHIHRDRIGLQLGLSLGFAEV
jgi:hypothetical protein